MGDDNCGDCPFGVLSLTPASSSITIISVSDLFLLLLLGDLLAFGDPRELPSPGVLLFGDASFSSLLFFEVGVDGFFAILSLSPALDGVLFPSEECFLDLWEVFSLLLSALCFRDLDLEGVSLSKHFFGVFLVGDCENVLSELYFLAWRDNG